MSNGKFCHNCKHSQYDKQSEDFVCSNPNSENFADWTDFRGYCDEWEDKNEQTSVHKRTNNWCK